MLQRKLMKINISLKVFELSYLGAQKKFFFFFYFILFYSIYFLRSVTFFFLLFVFNCSNLILAWFFNLFFSYFVNTVSVSINSLSFCFLLDEKCSFFYLN